MVIVESWPRNVGGSRGCCARTRPQRTKTPRSGRPLDAHDVHDRLVRLLCPPQARSGARGHRLRGGQHRAAARRRGDRHAGEWRQPDRPDRRVLRRHGDDQPLGPGRQGEARGLSWRPIAPEQLAATVAPLLTGSPRTVRVAIDGAPAADPDRVAASLLPVLEAAGRPVRLVRAALFWRDASLRLEFGREDPDSYASWLDAEALRREVLDPALEEGRYLPSLRDPETNRSTREPPQEAP